MNDAETVFTEIFKKNTWGNKESVSGYGSTRQQSEAAAERLQFLSGILKIKTMADIPCGDGNFISCMDLGKIKYTGYEVVAELVKVNKKRFAGNENMDFKFADATTDIIGKVDLIFCRDMIIHLPNQKIIDTLKNFKKSGSKWLLITYCTAHAGGYKNLNIDIPFGHYRPVDLTKPPFKPAAADFYNSGD